MCSYSVDDVVNCALRTFDQVYTLKEMFRKSKGTIVVKSDFHFYYFQYSEKKKKKGLEKYNEV